MKYFLYSYIPHHSIHIQQCGFDNYTRYRTPSIGRNVDYSINARWLNSTIQRWHRIWIFWPSDLLLTSHLHCSALEYTKGGEDLLTVNALPRFIPIESMTLKFLLKAYCLLGNCWRFWSLSSYKSQAGREWTKRWIQQDLQEKVHKQWEDLWSL